MSATETKEAPVRVRDEGFTVLSDPKEATADIVLIHGLQGHPKETWWYYQKALPIPFKKRRETSCYWPEELLPQSFPKCRILTYGYDTRVTYYFSRAADKSNILDHARAFLDEFEEFRREAIGRAVVFIAHSLGGLLLKAVLRKASSIKSDAPDARVIRDICTSTAGTIFLGTPHRGSDYADLGQKVALAARALQFDRSTSILRDLKVDSSILEILHESFLELIHSQKFALFTFAEGRGLGIPFIARDKVVPKWSAHFGLTDEVEQKGDINADHRNMCRFDGVSSPGYGKVRRAIDRCIRGQTDRLENPGFLDALRQLNTRETRLRYEQVEKAYKDTYNWIFTKESLGLEAWLQSTTEPLFWIKGKPASGKSTLMKFVVNHRKTARSFRRPTRRICTASFFFHDRGSYLQKTLDGLMREILYAVNIEIPELRSLFYEAYQAHKPRDPSTQFSWHWDIMLPLFLSIMEQDIIKVSILLFIDALDEYSGNHNEIVRFLQSSKGSNKTELKICFSSRPEQIFLDHFNNLPGFYIHDYTKGDMNKIIRAAFEENPRMMSTLNSEDAYNLSIVKVLQKALVEESNGVFLWLKLALEDILTEYTNGTSLQGLIKLLEHLPKELDEYYDHIMQRHANERYSQELDIMLEVMTCADGPLSLDEIFTAIQLFHVKDLRKHKLDLPSVEDAKRQITSRCGPLIEFVGDHRYSDSEDSDTDSFEPERFVSTDPDQHHLRSPLDLVNHEVQFLHQTVRAWAAKKWSTSTVLPEDNGYTALLKVEIYKWLVNGSSRSLSHVLRCIRDVESVAPCGTFAVLKQVENITVYTHSDRAMSVRHLALLADAPVLFDELRRCASMSPIDAFGDFCDLLALEEELIPSQDIVRVLLQNIDVKDQAAVWRSLCGTLERWNGYWEYDAPAHPLEHVLRRGMDPTTTFEMPALLHGEEVHTTSTFLHEAVKSIPKEPLGDYSLLREIVDLVVDLGFDMNVMDGNSKTVLDLALGQLQRLVGEIELVDDEPDQFDIAPGCRNLFSVCEMLLGAGAKASRPGNGIVITAEKRALLKAERLRSLELLQALGWILPVEEFLEFDERLFNPPVLLDTNPSTTWRAFGGLSISSLVPSFLQSPANQ